MGKKVFRSVAHFTELAVDVEQMGWDIPSPNREQIARALHDAASLVAAAHRFRNEVEKFCDDDVLSEFDAELLKSPTPSRTHKE